MPRKSVATGRKYANVPSAVISLKDQVLNNFSVEEVTAGCTDDELRDKEDLPRPSHPPKLNEYGVLPIKSMSVVETGGAKQRRKRGDRQGSIIGLKSTSSAVLKNSKSTIIVENKESVSRGQPEEHQPF